MITNRHCKCIGNKWHRDDKTSQEIFNRRSKPACSTTDAYIFETPFYETQEIAANSEGADGDTARVQAEIRFKMFDKA